MNRPLDELYLGWLYSLAGYSQRGRHPQTHWGLLTQLYHKEFVWSVPNDDNRLVDGVDLRVQFLELHQIRTPDPQWMDVGCNMLELLIATSRRLSFLQDGEPSVWFWHLIEVLNLEQYNDANYNMSAEGVIDDTLNRVIYRQYAANGEGGLFPLRNPTRDQRTVELWYQLNAYLNEL